jgi:hypothetical protein
VKYGDLRPAFRGDAAIVPPTQHKVPPSWAEDFWQQARAALEGADCVLAVGYSFAPYDTHVWNLFKNSVLISRASIHIFSPNAAAICARLSATLPGLGIAAHSGLPEGISDVAAILT